MKFTSKHSDENTLSRAYRMRLYPNAQQRILISKTFGCCRFVYNRFLDERITEYRNNGRTINYYDNCRELIFLKQQKETEWLKEVDSTALQFACRNLQDAYDNFFRGIKENRDTGFPKFRRKHDYRKSYRSTCINNNIRILDKKHIQLPKLGSVKCKISRPVEGKILSATVIQEPDGKYYVSVSAKAPGPEPLPQTGMAVGIDAGIKDLIVTSDQVRYDNPKSYHKLEKRLALEQRRLSRKTSGSMNWQKQRNKVARLHSRIRHQREDTIHKMTHELVRNYDVICIEDLNVYGMIQNHHLAKALADSSLGEIRRQLQYKSEWYGKEIRTADRWYASSQTCSVCGYKNEEVKDLSVRKWECPVCGSIHDRDVNAARNILTYCMSQ